MEYRFHVPAFIAVCSLLVIASCQDTSRPVANNGTGTRVTDSLKTNDTLKSAQPPGAQYEGYCGFRVTRVLFDTSRNRTHPRWDYDVSFNAKYPVAIFRMGPNNTMTQISFDAVGKGNDGVEILGQLFLIFNGGTVGTYNSTITDLFLWYGNDLIQYYPKSSVKIGLTKLYIKPDDYYHGSVVGEFSGIFRAPNGDTVAVRGKFNGC